MHAAHSLRLGARWVALCLPLMALLSPAWMQWRHPLHAVSPADALAGWTSSPLLLTLAGLCACWAMVGQARRARWLLAPLALLAPAEALYVAHFGVPSGAHVYAVVAETHWEELSSFIGADALLYLALLLAWAGLLAWTFRRWGEPSWGLSVPCARLAGCTGQRRAAAAGSGPLAGDATARPGGGRVRRGAAAHPACDGPAATGLRHPPGDELSLGPAATPAALGRAPRGRAPARRDGRRAPFPAASGRRPAARRATAGGGDGHRRGLARRSLAALRRGARHHAAAAGTPRRAAGVSRRRVGRLGDARVGVTDVDAPPPRAGAGHARRGFGGVGLPPGRLQDLLVEHAGQRRPARDTRRRDGRRST
jgi:hypothetical protein